MAQTRFEKFKDIFEDKIAEDMSKRRIPGTVMALVEKGKVIYEASFGARDRATNTSVDRNSLFGIGSCTKSFTSLAILQLVEKQLLSIDDPVAKYLPLRLGHKEKPITLRHLMSHSSGIPALDTSLKIHYFLDEEKDVPIIPMSSREDIMRFINNAQDEVIFEPGEQFFYFNGGYDLLGFIIEDVSGLKYKDYIQQNIFQPLGMSASCFIDEKEFLESPDIARGYVNKKDAIVGIQRTIDFNLYAAGGIVSNIPDLALYIQAVMSGDKRLLQEEGSWAALTSRQSASDMMPGLIPEARYEGYGLGWVLLSDFHGKKVLRHGGNTGNYSTQIVLLPELEVGVILLSNASASPSTCHVTALLQAYLGLDPLEHNFVYKKQKHWKKLTGKYSTYKDIYNIEVVNKGGTLFVNFISTDDPFDFPIFPANDDLECMHYYSYNDFAQKDPLFFFEKNDKIYLKVERSLYTKK